MSLDNNDPLPSEPQEPAASAPVTPPSFSGIASDLPQDLRAPWDWLDLLLLAVLALVGSALISWLLSVVLAGFGVDPAQLRASPSKSGLFAIVHQALLFFGLLGYLAAQIRINFGAPFWRTIGWRPFETGGLPSAVRYFGFIAGGFLLAAFVQVVSAAYGNRVKVPMQVLFQDRRTALLLLLMAVFVAPIVEETIFRGYIYPVVARRFGIPVGVVATGIVFGLLHAPQLRGAWVQIGLLVIVGVILTYARAVTRTVLASYLLHVSYNCFTSFAFLLGSHWLRLIPPSH
jgi:uncharacterized protein